MLHVLVIVFLETDAVAHLLGQGVAGLLDFVVMFMRLIMVVVGVVERLFLKGFFFFAFFFLFFEGVLF